MWGTQSGRGVHIGSTSFLSWRFQGKIPYDEKAYGIRREKKRGRWQFYPGILEIKQGGEGFLRGDKGTLGKAQKSWKSDTAQWGDFSPHSKIFILWLKVLEGNFVIASATKILLPVVFMTIFLRSFPWSFLFFMAQIMSRPLLEFWAQMTLPDSVSCVTHQWNLRWQRVQV